MKKTCIVESSYGIKLGVNRIANPNVPIDLNPKEILRLLKRNNVKVFHIVGSERIQQTIDNYDSFDYTVENTVPVEEPVEPAAEPVKTPEADIKKQDKKDPVESKKLVKTPEADTKEQDKKDPIVETPVVTVKEDTKVAETSVIDETVKTVEDPATIEEEVKKENKPVNNRNNNNRNRK